MSSASPVDLSIAGERRVAIAGDWHGNRAWVQRAIPLLAREAKGISTLLHVGDLGIWREPKGKGFLQTVDYWCQRAGIDRVLVTPGNHENWDLLDAAFAREPGHAVQLSKVVTVLPRAFRFTLAGRSFLSFGGAASLDYADRTAGQDFWQAEMPTENDVATAIAGGPVDVLLTHEAVNGGAPAVDRMIAFNPLGWPADAVAYSARSRARVTQVWDELRPSLLAHGHMHVKDEIGLPDGRRVYSMGMDGDDGNLAVLALDDLDWTWVN
jgi:hypothetical protein